MAETYELTGYADGAFSAGAMAGLWLWSVAP